VVDHSGGECGCEVCVARVGDGGWRVAAVAKAMRRVGRVGGGALGRGVGGLGIEERRSACAGGCFRGVTAGPATGQSTPDLTGRRDLAGAHLPNARLWVTRAFSNALTAELKLDIN